MKWPWVSRAALEQTQSLLAEAVRDRRIAEDRLYAAWKDGNTIPPRESVTPQPPKEIHLLPDTLRDYIGNWESPEVRMELEAEARRMHFELGYPEDRVIETFQRRIPETAVVE
ncbi:MAG TPA: hypothetical protein VJS20_12785 [Gemmatimonadales bacterium]|nr:hypothetical protein [Gemmatimonadales bacterium]